MMTREEAIVLFEKQLTAAQVVLDSGFGSNPGENDSLYRRRKEMAEIALSALRPVSREQVEKIRGEWLNFYNDFSTAECSKCGELFDVSDTNENLKVLFDAFKKYYQFCPSCGAPMTDKAVGMVMKRLEEICK